MPPIIGGNSVTLLILKRERVEGVCELGKRWCKSFATFITDGV
jgi:hypothetical protein